MFPQSRSFQHAMFNCKCRCGRMLTGFSLLRACRACIYPNPKQNQPSSPGCSLFPESGFGAVISRTNNLQIISRGVVVHSGGGRLWRRSPLDLDDGERAQLWSLSKGFAWGSGGVCNAREWGEGVQFSRKLLQAILQSVFWVVSRTLAWVFLLRLYLSSQSLRPAHLGFPVS